MSDRPTRVEIIAALHDVGVEPGAGLAEIQVVAAGLGLALSVVELPGHDVRGRPAPMWQATAAREGDRVAVWYSSESAQAAAFEALGRALLYERRARQQDAE